MLMIMMMILTMIMVLMLARYFSSLLFTVFLNHLSFPPFASMNQTIPISVILYSLFFIFPMTYVPLLLFLNTLKTSPLQRLYTSFNFFCFVLISFYFVFSVDGKFNSKSVSRKRKRFPATKHAFQSR